MIETHDQEICSLEAEIDRLTAERDRQYDQNVEQIVQIASLQAKVDELEGDLNIMRLQRDATHVSRCPKCAATEQVDPDHEAENRMCACPTCINNGWAEQEGE